MNKEKIVEELNEYMKGLDPRFSVVNQNYDDDLELRYDGVGQAWFGHFVRENFDFSVESDLCELFVKKDYLKTFYNKAVELMDKYDKHDKYTVSLSKDCAINYLNVHKKTGVFFFSTNATSNNAQVYFTKTEIENMKNDPRFKAINFDKAIIEEVEE